MLLEAGSMNVVVYVSMVENPAISTKVCVNELSSRVVLVSSVDRSV